MSGKSKTQVVLLGTGTPNADPDRCGPSLAIVVGDHSYLVDFGPGVVRQAAAAHRLGVGALAVERLERAFLTHLHSDHTAGFADLILTPWVLERGHPLKVFGPKGIAHMSSHILTAYQLDIRERVEGLEPANSDGWWVKVEEICMGWQYVDDRISVEAFPVNHGSWDAFGYRFETDEGIIVVSGDTAPYPEMIKHYSGCSILIHEVYSIAGLESRLPEWQHYHKSVHTSSAELAKVAAQVQPDLLVLNHMLLWGQSQAGLLAEIRQNYLGRVVCGKDLDIFTL